MFSSSFWLYPPLRSGHTLCIALRLSLRVSLLVSTEIIHKNSCLILRLKKKAAIYERYVYTLLCVLIIILLAYRFLPVGSSTKTAQVHPVFSRQSCIDVKTGCAEPLIINVVLGQLWLMYSCGGVFS